ncbi:NAD(P)H-hydrate dehydratase [Frigoriglobus tundricola]|uniref:ADP-dependent (S)-NAD(P)H-hydrate dehydratase n=1 Tax=Frigoriglobus tundricola TaxID=2774151 RepID=A0A6M5YK65_9BACT|nr:NAD(P)H-hydrate dehydratase [Frigoriglobus tundricola]QJW93676.1 NAD(P)H-hydrate epimerase / ADP-dependent (S)-NAD(P)H-hydrate dehydratase [Frigoriglobus tundricola]
MDATPIHELPRLPRRAAAGHKGTYGKVLVVAGSRGMSGAAVLCGRAALRAGAGLVQVASPVDVQEVVAAGCPAYMTTGIRQHADGSFGDGTAEETFDLARSADVLAIGPGLGRGQGTGTFVRSVLDEITDKPVVLDADGLFAVSPFTGVARRTAPLVLTPHPGEFARLTGDAAPTTDAERHKQAVAFARMFGCVLLLKGSGTLVTDGANLYRNTTGNPGMATGGSGDVLTGVIAALIGQGLGALDAAVLGAWVHGRAGDLGAGAIGQTALTAPDLVEHLPAAFRELETHW